MCFIFWNWCQRLGCSIKEDICFFFNKCFLIEFHKFVMSYVFSTNQWVSFSRTPRSGRHYYTLKFFCQLIWRANICWVLTLDQALLPTCSNSFSPYKSASVCRWESWGRRRSYGACPGHLWPVSTACALNDGTADWVWNSMWWISSSLDTSEFQLASRQYFKSQLTAYIEV